MMEQFYHHKIVKIVNPFNRKMRKESPVGFSSCRGGNAKTFRANGPIAPREPLALGRQTIPMKFHEVVALGWEDYLSRPHPLPLSQRERGVILGLTESAPRL
jgi:hypothetical protein